MIKNRKNNNSKINNMKNKYKKMMMQLHMKICQNLLDLQLKRF